VARVVELGFGTRWPTRVRMRLRWACGGGHLAVPAWAGCLMILCLYPAMWISLLSGGSLVTPELIASCAHFARATARFVLKRLAGQAPAHQTRPAACPPCSGRLAR
jgi:hypothetical protein